MKGIIFLNKKIDETRLRIIKADFNYVAKCIEIVKSHLEILRKENDLELLESSLKAIEKFYPYIRRDIRKRRKGYEDMTDKLITLNLV